MALPAGDPYWYYKVLGIHCDGANNSTTYTDVKGKTVTANGDAKVSTAQYPALTGKTSSAYFDGTGDYLALSSSADFALGTGDFTIKALVRLTANALVGGSTLFDFRASYGASPFTVYVINSGSGNFAACYTSLGASGLQWDGAMSLNTWYEIELVRESGSWTLRIDGTARGFTLGTATSENGNLGGSSNQLRIGIAVDNSSAPFTGYISEVEIYKGVALHTADFTPSSDPFPDTYVRISGTTKDAGGSFASRLVRVYRQDTGAFVGEQLSNGTTGEWVITAVNTGSTVTKHFAVMHDDDANPPTTSENAIVYDNITPY